MVAHQAAIPALTDNEVDALFHALADRTRRDIVARVAQREQSLSALAERYAMSFTAVQKHVAVLERAGLVRKQRSGREQLVHGEVEAVRRASRLLDDLENLWRHRAAQMETLLMEQDTEER